MKRKGSAKRYVYLFLLALICVGLIYILPEIEWHSPEIRIHLSSEYLGLNPFEVELRDRGKGIKKFKITLTDKYGEVVILERTYPSPVIEDSVLVKINPETLGIKSQKATLRVTAVDDSKIRLFIGNKTTVKKNVVIDFIPPTITVMSTGQYIMRGGSGVVIYEVSEDTANSGVQVGENFFPGYGGYFINPHIHMAFYSHPYNISSGVRAVLSAVDKAGNTTLNNFNYILKENIYTEKTVNISDSFIINKVAPLYGKGSENKELKEIFLTVNRELRSQNDNTITDTTKDSSPSILWYGPFHQLSNSKVEAGFPDRRTYIYKGKIIDKQYHLGYDLAVVKRYPVEAANSGVVAFTGDLGIYGQSVILDHGFGIFTLYSHMSSTGVKKGENIKKKQVIGRTGQTGLAGGDHLHFGVYISGVPVNPLEWWDRSWVYENLISQIEDAESRFGVPSSNVGFLPKKQSRGGGGTMRLCPEVPLQP